MRRIFKTVEDHLIECTTLEKGVWVHLQSPTKEEVDGLTTRFGLDPTFLPAALDEEESARVDYDPDKQQTLILVDIPYVETEGSGYVYSTIPLGIVLCDEVIITVCTRDTPIINDFTEERIRNFWTYKRARFILQLLHRNAGRFLSYLKQIDKASLLVQEKLEKASRNQELLQMMKLEKSLVYFSTSLKGNALVLERLMRQDVLKRYPEDTDLLEDVIIENKQAIEMCSIYRDIMNNTTEAFASVISNNLNITMKTLTSLTVLLSVPTIIASLWGMNVAVPFEGSSWGFWIVLGIAAVVALVSAFFMARKNMFH
ncbi:MAG: magnesium transporter CorA family protein [Clostridia bacterium]|nr:magnesium transporter CorA family protein [Clostridia bacterium]